MENDLEPEYDLKALKVRRTGTQRERFGETAVTQNSLLFAECTMADEIPDWFWRLIESSEHKLQCLAEKLELLTKEQLIAFQFQYEDAKELVSPMWADEADEIGAYIEECSEDHADDFADWVVSQGRVFFDAVRNNPASGPEYLTMYEQHDRDEKFSHLCWNDDVEREEYRGWQSPGFIARGVYEYRFGESLYELIANRA